MKFPDHRLAGVVRRALLLLSLSLPALSGCGGSGADTSVPPPPRVRVSVAPGTATLLTGESQQFTAAVSGASNQAVTWSLEGFGAGNDQVGFISSDGLYTTPAAVPEPPTVTVRATSMADPAGFGTAAVTVNSPVEDWPKFGRDLANTGRSHETGLSSRNVGRLQRKWTFDTGTKISASPAVATVGGVRTVYVGNWLGEFFAVNATTGVQRWKFTVAGGGPGCATAEQCRITSSAAVANGVVFFGTATAHVYALNAATGVEVWRRQLGDPAAGYEIWSSPAVHNGVVYLGLASHQANPCVVGEVVALDAASGTVVWRFETIDQATCSSGFCVGAGVWSSAAIDTEFGLLWVGTGNAGRGCSPATSNAALYPDGLLALDLATGAVVDFFQTFVNDLNDEGDIGAAPALHETRVENQCTGAADTRHWVSVPTKDSFSYTAPRGATGLLDVPVGIGLSSGDAIASPAVIPVTQSSACGAGPEQLVETGNDVLVPTFDGRLFDIRQQGSDGSVGIRWQLQASGPCPATSPCPLFSAPATITDLIIFGGGEGNLKIVREDGLLVKSLGTLGLVAGGPAISHSTVYYTSFDGVLYAASLDGQ